MENRLKHITTGLPFPNIPEKWTHEEQRFAYGLRDLIEQLFATRYTRRQVEQLQNMMYPVGIVVIIYGSANPFTFGTWAQVGPDVEYPWLPAGSYSLWKRTA